MRKCWHLFSFLFWYRQISSQVIAHRTHSYHCQPIGISIFTYLFHSACGVLPSEPYWMLLIGDKPHVPLLHAAGAASDYHVSGWWHFISASPTSLTSFQITVTVFHRLPSQVNNNARLGLLGPHQRASCCNDYLPSQRVKTTRQNARRSCWPRLKSCSTNITLPKPQKWQCTSRAAWALPIRLASASRPATIHTTLSIM